MLRKLAAIVVVIVISQSSFAQTIRGAVKDTSENRNLSSAVISLIKKSDSILVSFVRSDRSGSFTLNAASGEYILLVTYPKYADYVETITLGNETKDVGTIILTPKSQLLQEVIVRQQLGAVRIKGDTLAFMADSFFVKEGANVEELLKRLPGIQVNRNGEITAHGERVQKVLVDGEEFFSDDPAMVTQNLRADAVKEVQVFDKKSDQAAFTGIDDGEKTKTINLKLKDDRKRGVFGKVSLGAGLPSNFSNEGMINAFKGKRKVAAFGIMSNTGRIGLNWQDSERYGTSSMQYNEEEGYFFSISTAGDDDFGGWSGSFYGQGLPTAWTGGLHFSNKWAEDKNHLNGNYRYNKINVIGNASTITQYILPDTQYFNNQQQRINRQNIRHQLTGSYEVNLDSSSSLKLSLTASDTRSGNLSQFFSEALNADKERVNTSDRIITSLSDRQQLIGSLLWRKKFKKAGRTVSINVDQNYNANNFDGILQARNEYYDANQVFATDSVDQKKENRVTSLSLGSRVAYTEPLSKSLFLELNYSFRVNNSQALRTSLDRSASGKYEILNPVFSNDYAFRVNTNSGGLNFRVNRRLFNFSVGGNVSKSAFRQKDLIADTLYTYSFTNFFPRANFRYNIKPQTRLSFSYNGNTRQPNLEQIQPIRENTDPLNIQIGNPDLEQEFRHTLNLSFSDYKVLSSRNIYVGANFHYINNAISSSSIVDNVGRRVNQFVNVDGNFNINSYTGIWKQIKKIGLDVGVNFDMNISRNNTIINGVRNTTRNRSLNGGINLGHRIEKKYSIYIYSRTGHVQSTSSIRPDVVTRYWTNETNTDANVELPWKMQLNTSAAFQFRQKTDVFDRDNNVIRWNAYLAKKFWKNNAGEIRFTVFDILDQNIGFNRTATSNFIMENTYDTFRRYWLLSFTWNFATNGAAPQTTH